jgi:hypothetical protein
MIGRRGLHVWTADEIIKTYLDAPVELPSKTIRLRRNSILDQKQRQYSADISPAELYHENSKYFPGIEREVLCYDVDIAAVCGEIARKRMLAISRANCRPLELPAAWQNLLNLVGNVAGIECYFSSEVRIIYDGNVGVFNPLDQSVGIYRGGDSIEFEQLLPGAGVTHGVFGLNPMALIVGNFARSEVLFGRRGYRQALLQAGQLSEQFLRTAHNSGVQLKRYFEFMDREADRIVGCDGIEESVLSILL